MSTGSIRSNIQAVRNTLNDVAKRQLPFAIARALTATAKDVQGVLTTALPRQLDKPTPFTMKAFAVTPATKQSLTAKVYIKPAQWKYLRYQIEGGVRKPNKRVLIVPKAIRLNQYGNMQRGAIKKLLTKAKVFSGTIDGVSGIYERKGRGQGSMQLVVGYSDKVAYRKRYPFKEIAHRAVPKLFDRHFRVSMAAALASMR